MGARTIAVLAAVLGAAAGFALASWRDGGGSPAAAPAAAPPQAAPEPAAPAGGVGDDDERARLQAENRRLRDVVEALEAQIEMLARAEEEADEPPTEEAEQPGFDAAALEAAGWLPAEIERLRERLETYELDRLYLRNQAAREGWRGTPRFMREMRGLRTELRAELGDADFDAALYGAGHNNRVAVQGLLDRSAAQAAGLRPGDEILRYAGERIFDAFALIRLTAQGKAGDPVELRVIRDGEELRFFLPRGPLGVRLKPASRPPV